MHNITKACCDFLLKNVEYSNFVAKLAPKLLGRIKQRISFFLSQTKSLTFTYTLVMTKTS